MISPISPSKGVGHANRARRRNSILFFQLNVKFGRFGFRTRFSSMPGGGGGSSSCAGSGEARNVMGRVLVKVWKLDGRIGSGRKGVGDEIS